MEHPAIPTWQPKASSVWKTAVVGWVSSLKPAVKLVDFNQGLHGQRGKKPTRLMALRLEGLQSLMNVRQTPAEFDLEQETSAPLVGRDEAGKFRTAKAKEYPSSMCSGIATAMLNALRERSEVEPGTSHGNLLDSVAGDLARYFDRLVVQYDPYEVQAAEHRPDYAAGHYAHRCRSVECRMSE